VGVCPCEFHGEGRAARLVGKAEAPAAANLLDLNEECLCAVGVCPCEFHGEGRAARRAPKAAAEAPAVAGLLELNENCVCAVSVCPCEFHGEGRAAAAGAPGAGVEAADGRGELVECESETEGGSRSSDAEAAIGSADCAEVGGEASESERPTFADGPTAPMRCVSTASSSANADAELSSKAAAASPPLPTAPQQHPRATGPVLAAAAAPSELAAASIGAGSGMGAQPQQVDSPCSSLDLWQQQLQAEAAAGWQQRQAESHSGAGRLPERSLWHESSQHQQHASVAAAAHEAIKQQLSFSKEQRAPPRLAAATAAQGVTEAVKEALSKQRVWESELARASQPASPAHSPSAPPWPSYSPYTPAAPLDLSSTPPRGAPLQTHPPSGAPTPPPPLALPRQSAPHGGVRSLPGFFRASPVVLGLISPPLSASASRTNSCPDLEIPQGAEPSLLAIPQGAQLNLHGAHSRRSAPRRAHTAPPATLVPFSFSSIEETRSTAQFGPSGAVSSPAARTGSFNSATTPSLPETDWGPGGGHTIGHPTAGNPGGGHTMEGHLAHPGNPMEGLSMEGRQEYARTHAEAIGREEIAREEIAREEMAKQAREAMQAQMRELHLKLGGSDLRARRLGSFDAGPGTVPSGPASISGAGAFHGGPCSSLAFVHGGPGSFSGVASFPSGPASISGVGGSGSISSVYGGAASILGVQSGGAASLSRITSGASSIGASPRSTSGQPQASPRGFDGSSPGPSLGVTRASSASSLFSDASEAISAIAQRLGGRAATASSAPRPPLRAFTRDEVATHYRMDDCWLIAHGKVYDVTPFLAQHPAGDLSILRHAGTDATIDFDFHSPNGCKMWRQYQVGYIEGQGGCAIS